MGSSRITYSQRSRKFFIAWKNAAATLVAEEVGFEFEVGGAVVVVVVVVVVAGAAQLTLIWKDVIPFCHWPVVLQLAGKSLQYVPAVTTSIA